MITEKLMAAGGWSIKLKPTTPQSILDELDLDTRAFSLVAITPSRLEVGNLSAYTPSTVRSVSRYVGVYRSRPDKFTIEGGSLAVLLGDENGKGPILTTGYSRSAGTLSDWIGDFLTGNPNGISSGTITNTLYTQTASYRYVTVRQAIDAVCLATNATWRINPTLTLDAATSGVLFVSSPTVMAMRGGDGSDPAIIGIRAIEFDAAGDVEDYATSVIVIARGTGAIDVQQYTTLGIPYYAPDGAVMNVTRILDSGNITPTDANTVASNEILKTNSVRRALTLLTDDYDIKGKLAPGDLMWVYDPTEDGLTGTTHVRFRGVDVFPAAMRVFGYEWPVLQGMGVYLLTSESSPRIIDLTDWFEPEEAGTRIEVGARDRVFTSTSGGGAGDYSDAATAAYVGDARDIVAAPTGIPFFPNGGASVGNGSTMRPGTTSGSYTELWRGDFYATGVNITYDISIYPNGSTMDWRLMVYENGGGTPTSAAGETGQTSNAQKSGTVAIPTGGLISGTDPKGKNMTARLEARRTAGSTSVDIAINATAVNN